MSILEELYNGNVNPSGKYIRKGSEYQRINNQLTDDIEKLIGMLNEEERQLCKRIEDNLYKLGYITEKERFIEGFGIGVQLMCEILNYKSESFIN